MPSSLAMRPLAARLALGLAVCLTTAPALSTTLNASTKDGSGNPVAGVVLTLRDSSGNQVAQQRTDARGTAAFDNLPAGQYVIQGSGSGVSAASQAVAVADGPPLAVTVVVSFGTRLTPVDVVATRLKEARIALSPKVGTTVYSLDQGFVADYGAGENTTMNDVLLRLPGVAQDSKASGSLHVRDEHANVQYRINGIQLPEGISGFGQSVDSRVIDRVDFVTGTLPAQYGLRTAGVVDIETKDGSAMTPGGSIGVLIGGHDSFQPSLELVGSKGALSYYATGNFLTNTLGIENPTPSRNAIHDRTQQVRGFGYLSYVVDESTRVGLMLGTYLGQFEIPNNPGQAPAFSLTGVSDAGTGFNARPSSDLDERQREANHYAVLSLQQSRGLLDFQASIFYQYSSLHYLPDPQGGDLIYNGVSSDVFKSNSAAGIQADAAYKFADNHTARFGFDFAHQHTTSTNIVGVFPVDDAGAQIGSEPRTISDTSSKGGDLTGVYLQDEWRVTPRLTVNYGARFDRVAAFTDEQQLSPRLNALWKVSASTAIHAGYARYFTPPPQELVAQKSIDLFAGTTNAPEIAESDTVKAERTHYFDVGISQTLSPRLTIGVDAYYKRITNLLDEGQFGQALILTPFNYAEGHAEGIEVSAVYSAPELSGYLNVSVGKAKGKNIVSGQSLFSADELAYIADHFVYLDHDQRYSVSGGVTYRMGATRLSADAIYGSGLRRTPDGAAPNSGKLPSYFTANLALAHSWNETSVGGIDGRVGMTNLFDKTYLLRDGSGIGVGAPQFGERRTWFAALSHAF